MKIHVLKIKLINYIQNQKWIKSSIGIMSLCISYLIPYQRYKLRLYDIYLRTNPYSSRTKVVLNKAIETCSKILVLNDPQKPIKLIRSIILKKYISEKEKGFLLISFESELLKLSQNPNLSMLEKKYEIAFLPSWHPFFSQSFYFFNSQIKHSFWMMPSSKNDAELCSIVAPLCQPLPFQASSWTDSTSFPEVPKNKDIDIIMVATFLEFKRHWLLFEALQDLPINLKVTLLGKSFGSRTREVFLAEADLFGVKDRFELIEDPSYETIRTHLGRAKLFCALSAKEGSYIAVAESLLAGTPVGMFEDAIIGSKDYINSTTGVLFNNNEKLATQILRFLNLKTIQPFEIQKWARDNISAQINNIKLNNLVRDSNLRKGNNWTQDLSPIYCKHFDFYYFDNPVAEAEYINIANEFSVYIDRPN